MCRYSVVVRGLEAQQVAVAAGLAPDGEVLVRPLAEAQRDRRDGRLRADAAQHAGHPLGGDAVVLARLHHQGAVAERDRLAGAVEDDVLGDAVALDAAVAGADAAVGAAAHAVVAHLDQAAEVDGVADVAAPRLVRRGPQRLQPRLVGLAQPPLDGVARERVGDAEGRGEGSGSSRASSRASGRRQQRSSTAASSGRPAVTGSAGACPARRACAARIASRAAGNGCSARSKIPRLKAITRP